MPSKKKKYNARFPSGRIKKIMQTDEEVGKVAQAVPVIISRTLELFVNSLLTKAMEITSARNAKTLTPSHMKQCILSESRFDFLKDLVKALPDATSADLDEGCNPINYSVPTSNNPNNATESRSHADHTGPTSARHSTETRQTQSGMFSNGTNPNFYTENLEESRFNNPVGPRVQLPSSTIGRGTGNGGDGNISSDDDNEDGLDEVPLPIPASCVPIPTCIDVDEDYDT